MHEGLQLFEEVVQNPIFQNTPMFVFLNKKDLFEQMMREDGVPLTRCFPDYRVSQSTVCAAVDASSSANLSLLENMSELLAYLWYFHVCGI